MPTFPMPLALAAALLLPAAGNAAICDYKPSRLLGSMATAANDRTGGPAAAASAAGHYTLVHAKTGLTMLGAVGGTSGLATGASGFLASTIAFVTAPATIIAGSVTAVALGGYEGACYFSVERVTDPELVTAILRNMEAQADPDRFNLVTPQDTGELTLVLRDPATPEEVETYEVRNLYIADGMLLHRDRLLNTRIGKVIFVDDTPADTDG